MIRNSHFLRRVLAIDAIGTGAMALAAVVAARPLSDILGIPAQWLVGTGLLLLPFAAWVGWLARQHNPPQKRVWLLIAANAVWIADSFVLALTGWLPMTALGVEFIVAQALLTAGITAMEIIAVRRAAVFSQLPA